MTVEPEPKFVRLIQVTAPHFTAGLTVNADGVVTDAAPIIGYARGKVFDEIRLYFVRRNWNIEEL